MQVKGGSAKSPTAQDRARLRIVGERYGATKIVLFEWSREKKIGWSVLGLDDAWHPSTIPEIFGTT
jgi:hypothetical protein